MEIKTNDSGQVTGLVTDEGKEYVAEPIVKGAFEYLLSKGWLRPMKATDTVNGPEPTVRRIPRCPQPDDGGFYL